MNRLFVTLLVCSVGMSVSVLPVAIAQAQVTNDQSDETEDMVTRVITANFTPSNNGVPGGTAGGGSRGGACPTDSVNSGARLVPVIASVEQNLTTDSNPSWLVYIDNTAVNQLFLHVSDREGSYDYQTILPIEEESGILKISLPEEAPELALDTPYQWSLAIICGETLRPDDPYVQGTIQRVAPLEEIEVSEMEQVAQFAEQGIWYDAIDTLASMRQSNPDNAELQSAWTALLENVGLEELAAAPLLF